MPTAIIADDERLMREQIVLRLNQVWPELTILGQAKNGAEAVDMVLQYKPDFAFLDIRMPVKTGIEAAQAIGNAAHIIFITAYDQYAVEAFEHGAIDYVLKPADAERLSTTVERLKKRVQQTPNDMRVLIEKLSQQIKPQASFLKWIQASIGAEIRLIAVEEILFFQSDEKYTRVQTKTVEALIRKPIRELIEELDPALFWQIHRSSLVNVNAIGGVIRDMRGRHLVQIKGLNEKLEVSRSYVHLFKQM